MILYFLWSLRPPPFLTPPEILSYYSPWLLPLPQLFSSCFEFPPLGPGLRLYTGHSPAWNITPSLQIKPFPSWHGASTLISPRPVPHPSHLCRIYVKLIAYILDFMYITHLHTFPWIFAQTAPSKETLDSLDWGLIFRFLEGRESIYWVLWTSP